MPPPLPQAARTTGGAGIRTGEGIGRRKDFESCETLKFKNEMSQLMHFLKSKVTEMLWDLLGRKDGFDSILMGSNCEEKWFHL